MTSIGTGYDLSSTTYSPDGRVFQVEYAGKAVENSGTALAIKCKNGVVFAVEKLVHSKTLVEGTNRRIGIIDLHAGMASAGLLADGRHLLNRCREEASNHRDNFESPIKGKSLAERIALYMQAYTLYGSVRPFGSALLLSACDDDGKVSLWTIEPSGLSYGIHAGAIGKGKSAAKNELEKLEFSSLTMEDGLKEAARIIYMIHDEAKDKDFELEMAWIGESSNGKFENVPEILLTSAIEYAKEALKATMELD